MSRPPVSVVVPFAGDRAAAGTMLNALAALELRPEDELLVAENTPERILSDHGRVRIVHVGSPGSAYRARNAGARAASGSWLLFIDADCKPRVDLLERLLVPEPAAGCGIVAGEARGSEDQTALLARWARLRRGLIASHGIAAARPAGTAANLLVHRQAFEQAGGFRDVRSDADADICWRIQDAGWALEYRPEAVVAHRDPERLGAVLRQARGYGAGRRWLRRIHGSEVPAPSLLAPLVRALGGATVWTLRRDFARALFKLLDGVYALALWWGYVAVANDRS